MHPALKALVDDPSLQRALYALVADDHRCVSRFGPLQLATYEIDGDDVLLQDEAVAQICAAIEEATGVSVTLEETQMNPMQVRIALPASVHLQLLRALLQPVDE